MLEVVLPLVVTESVTGDDILCKVVISATGTGISGTLVISPAWSIKGAAVFREVVLSASRLVKVFDVSGI